MDLLDALERNAAGRALALASATPGFEAHEERDVTWFTSASNSSIFNQVHLARFEPDRAPERIRAVIAGMRERGREAAWWVGPRSSPPELTGRLEEHGLRLIRSMPGMAADLGRLRDGGPPPGVTVEEVVGRAGLREWADLFLALNGLPNVLQGESLRPFRLFLGRVEGRAAGLGVLFRHSGVAGVYTIVTDPDFRRRGVATAVTGAVARAGREMGDRFAVLTATEMGHPVYLRMGFEDVCRVFVYRLDP